MKPGSNLSPPRPLSARIKPGMLIVLALTLFHLLTISPGHAWYGCDFALYLQHAKNILAGIDYARTGYLINPYRIISPAAYPPVLPLLLAPLYALFGLNFWIFKAAIVLFLGAMLGVTFLWAGRHLKTPLLYFFPLLLGLNPTLWMNKNSVFSDLPFLAFLYLAVLVVERRDRVYAEDGDRWWGWVVMGLLIYLSYGTRAVGIILVPSLLAHDLIHYRRLTLFSVGATLLASGALLLQGLILDSQGSGLTGYLIQLEDLGYQNFYNLFLAIKNLGRLTFSGTPPWIYYPLFACTLATALLGLIVQLKKELAFIHLMAVCYLGVLFLFPHQPVRYLFVLLPLFFLWFLMGLQALGDIAGNRTAKAATAFLLIALFFSYGAKYHALATGVPRPGVEDPAAMEVFQYLEKETDESSRIMFSNPRVLAFMTGRESSVWHCTPEKEDLLAYMNRIKATHLVLPLWKPECIDRLIRGHPDIFQLKLANGMFKVFVIDRNALARHPG